MNKEQLEFRLGKAKALLVIEQPFIATIVCSLPLELDDTINPPTLCTNGKWIKAHPGFIQALDDREVMWCLAHEVMHCVFQHMLRRGYRHPVLWNVAGDFVINAILEEDKIGKRPAGVLFDLDLYRKGKTSEGVYELLRKDCEQKGGGMPDQWDSCEDSPGDAASQAEAKADWEVKVSQAAAAAKMHGKLGSGLRQFVDDMLTPKVKWQDQLRDFFTKRAFVDRSYARPNRRFMSSGMYLPGKSGQAIDDILIAVDTSGSVTQQELSEFAAEMRAIKDDCCPPNTHVVYFHSCVYRHDEFGQDDELVVTAGQSGGTNFSPIFKFALDHDIRPCACVVLTDLYSPDFGETPDFPVIWASTGTDQAPFGEIIKLRS